MVETTVVTTPGALDADRARSYYGQALDLADQLGMRPLVAHCQLDLGVLYRLSGGGGMARGT